MRDSGFKGKLYTILGFNVEKIIEIFFFVNRIWDLTLNA